MRTRTRWAAVASAAALIPAALLSGCAALDIEFPPASGPGEATIEPGVPEDPGAAEGDWVPVWDDAFEMTVVEIIDGDTMRLRIDRTNDVVTTDRPISVRLIGINTPETYPEVECYGPEAEEALGALVQEGSVVLVAPDVDSWDNYNRRLFYVWTEDGIFINEALALGGYAYVNRYPPNTTLNPELEEAEERAQEARRGLWGACRR